MVVNLGMPASYRTSGENLRPLSVTMIAGVSEVFESLGGLMKGLGDDPNVVIR